MNIFKAPTFNRLSESIEEYLSDKPVTITIENVTRSNGEMYWIAVMIVNPDKQQLNQNYEESSRQHD